MNQPLISVVITIHNSEQTLAKCLDSIIEQPRYDEIELLCINDRSEDGSKSIVEKRSLPWLNAVGKGVSAARNTGIDFAHGQYIWFIDSDDQLIEKCVDDYLIGIVKRKQAELFVVGVRKKFRSKIVEVKNPKQCTYPVRTADTNQKFPIFKENILNSSWNKIYSLDFIKKVGVRYPQLTTGEDAIFNYRLFLNARSIITLPVIAYQFNIFSATSSKFYWKQDQQVAACKMVKLLIEVERKTTLIDQELLYINLIDILIATESNQLFKDTKMGLKAFKYYFQSTDLLFLRQQCQSFKTEVGRNYRLKARIAQWATSAYWYIKLRFIRK